MIEQTRLKTAQRKVNIKNMFCSSPLDRTPGSGRGLSHLDLGSAPGHLRDVAHDVLGRDRLPRSTLPADGQNTSITPS